LGPASAERKDGGELKEQLHQQIGQLKLELEWLKKRTGVAR
jgi:hypothetical protein